MDRERYQIVWADGHGFGIVREQHTHYAFVEFSHDGHSWSLYLDNEEFEPATSINLGHEEIQ